MQENRRNGQAAKVVQFPHRYRGEEDQVAAGGFKFSRSRLAQSGKPDGLRPCPVWGCGNGRPQNGRLVCEQCEKQQPGIGQAAAKLASEKKPEAKPARLPPEEFKAILGQAKELRQASPGAADQELQQALRQLPEFAKYADLVLESALRISKNWQVRPKPKPKVSAAKPASEKKPEAKPGRLPREEFKQLLNRAAELRREKSGASGEVLLEQLRSSFPGVEVRHLKGALSVTGNWQIAKSRSAVEGEYKQAGKADRLARQSQQKLEGEWEEAVKVAADWFKENMDQLGRPAKELAQAIFQDKKPWVKLFVLERAVKETQYRLLWQACLKAAEDLVAASRPEAFRHEDPAKIAEQLAAKLRLPAKMLEAALRQERMRLVSQQRKSAGRKVKKPGSAALKGKNIKKSEGPDPERLKTPRRTGGAKKQGLKGRRQR